MLHFSTWSFGNGSVDMYRCIFGRIEAHLLAMDLVPQQPKLSRNLPDGRTANTNRELLLIICVVVKIRSAADQNTPEGQNCRYRRHLSACAQSGIVIR